MDDSDGSARHADYLRTTFEVMDQAIAIRDSALRLVAWNPRMLTIGFVPLRHIRHGAPLRELYRDMAARGAYGPGDPDRIADERIAAILENRFAEVEILTDGEGRTMRVRRLRLPDGGLCTTHVDITEEVALQEQLRQSTKMDALGRLTGGIAHDMNNVLASVIGNLELAQQGGPRQADHVAAAMEAANRGARLTHRLLAFARRQPLSPRVVAPAPLLHDLLAMLRALLSEDIETVLHSDPCLWPVEVDPVQFESVVVNIALNARDAMPGGGRLAIRAANHRLDAAAPGLDEGGAPEFVSIAIADTGTGMAPEVAEKAFEPFFTTKDPGAGTGLGLAMAHGFVTQSGGRIEIRSRLGEGTTVEILLPRAARPCEPRAPAPPMAETGPPAPSRILVVEDNPQLRWTVSEMLVASGYAVTAAPDGPSALAELQAGGSFDLLLTDVVLPGGMNGRQVAEAVRGRIPGIRVIYMSGYSADLLMKDGRLDPGILLLQKPFRRADLLREIARVSARPSEA